MGEAEFAATVPTAAGDQAEAEAGEIGVALIQAASWRQRLTRALDPALGWRHAPTDPPLFTAMTDPLPPEKVGAGRS
jgi:hypothetical protein